MNPNRAFMLTISLVLLTAGPVMAGPATPVVIDRDIAGELVLRKTKKPHQVTTSVTVRPTAKLKIERGAKIGVAGGATITLMTNIEVFGDGDERAGFGPRDQHRAWGGIRVADSVELTLSNLFIVGADTGIQTGKRTKLSLKDCGIVRCETGVALTSGDHDMTNCFVTECVKSGIVGNSAFIDVKRSTISRCGEFGFHLSGKVSLSVSNSVIADNDVNMSTSFAAGKENLKLSNTALLRPRTLNIRHHNSQPIDARQCYWGTDDPRVIARLIEDGYDKPGVGQVDFAELLSELPADVGSSADPQ